MTVDMVNHPPHYKGHASGLECIEVTRYLSFCLGNAVKYLYRYEGKNGREDLEKAAWYLRHHVEQFGPFTNDPGRLMVVRLTMAEVNPCREAVYRLIAAGEIADALELLERWIAEDPPF